jgi:uncharacterized membrane protein
MNGETDRRPLVTAGVVLGIGMGGFVDGILFHQILQLHEMLSARRPPTTVVNIEVNMVWDGLFHAFTWATTAVGLWLLFRAGRRREVPWSGRLLFGSILAGWGLFNLVEGVIDHHVLQVHHVYERAGGISVWDWVFLASGVVLVVVGWALGRSADQGGGVVDRPIPT